MTNFYGIVFNDEDDIYFLTYTPYMDLFSTQEKIEKTLATGFCHKITSR
jgi:hypothetical protein